METRELLEQVKSGKISIEEAESYFKREPFEEMGYAKLDMHREVRSGFSEVIFCSGKADEHLLHIVGKDRKSTRRSIWDKGFCTPI